MGTSIPEQLENLNNRRSSNLKEIEMAETNKGSAKKDRNVVQRALHLSTSTERKEKKKIKKYKADIKKINKEEHKLFVEITRMTRVAKARTYFQPLKTRNDAFWRLYNPFRYNPISFSKAAGLRSSLNAGIKQIKLQSANKDKQGVNQAYQDLFRRVRLVEEKVEFMDRSGALESNMRSIYGSFLQSGVLHSNRHEFVSRAIDNIDRMVQALENMEDYEKGQGRDVGNNYIDKIKFLNEIRGDVVAKNKNKNQNNNNKSFKKNPEEITKYKTWMNEARGAVMAIPLPTPKSTVASALTAAPAPTAAPTAAAPAQKAAPKTAKEPPPAYDTIASVSTPVSTSAPAVKLKAQKQASKAAAAPTSTTVTSPQPKAPVIGKSVSPAQAQQAMPKAATPKAPASESAPKAAAPITPAAQSAPKAAAPAATQEAISKASPPPPYAKVIKGQSQPPAALRDDEVLERQKEILIQKLSDIAEKNPWLKAEMGKEGSPLNPKEIAKPGASLSDMKNDCDAQYGNITDYKKIGRLDVLMHDALVSASSRVVPPPVPRREAVAQPSSPTIAITDPVYKGLDGSLLNDDAAAKAKKGEGKGYVAEYAFAGVSELQGRRPDQEDRVVIDSLAGDVNLDGAKVLGQALAGLHASVPAGDDTNHPKGKTFKEQGSCAIACAIQGNQVYVANVGDSTAYVVRIDADGKVMDCQRLNNLHTPDNEKSRIEEAGGRVMRGRLWGLLGVSRAIGDKEYDGSGISSEAEMHQASVDIPEGGRAFLIVACDGMTEGLKMATKKNEEAYVANGVAEALKINPAMSPAEVANYMANRAHKGIKASEGVGVVEQSGDNISVVVAPIDINSKETKLVAVFDGHGGQGVSQHCQDNFMDQIKLQLVAQQTAAVTTAPVVTKPTTAPAPEPAPTSTSTTQATPEEKVAAAINGACDYNMAYHSVYSQQDGKRVAPQLPKFLQKGALEPKGATVTKDHVIVLSDGSNGVEFQDKVQNTQMIIPKGAMAAFNAAITSTEGGMALSDVGKQNLLKLASVGMYQPGVQVYATCDRDGFVQTDDAQTSLDVYTSTGVHVSGVGSSGGGKITEVLTKEEMVKAYTEHYRTLFAVGQNNNHDALCLTPTGVGCFAGNEHKEMVHEAVIDALIAIRTEFKNKEPSYDPMVIYPMGALFKAGASSKKRLIDAGITDTNGKDINAIAINLKKDGMKPLLANASDPFVIAMKAAAGLWVNTYASGEETLQRLTDFSLRSANMCPSVVKCLELQEGGMLVERADKLDKIIAAAHEEKNAAVAAAESSPTPKNAAAPDAPPPPPPRDEDDLELFKIPPSPPPRAGVTNTTGESSAVASSVPAASTAPIASAEPKKKDVTSQFFKPPPLPNITPASSVPPVPKQAPDPKLSDWKALAKNMFLKPPEIITPQPGAGIKAIPLPIKTHKPLPKPPSLKQSQPLKFESLREELGKLSTLDEQDKKKSLLALYKVCLEKIEAVHSQLRGYSEIFAGEEMGVRILDHMNKTSAYTIAARNNMTKIDLLTTDVLETRVKELAQGANFSIALLSQAQVLENDKKAVLQAGAPDHSNKGGGP